MEEGSVPSFKESLDNSLVEVAESPTLQLLLYPVIPSPLRDWVVGRGEVIGRKRLEEFLTYLNEQIEDLRNWGVTEEHIERFFSSEEWFDLFRRSLEEAQKTKSRERREIYARILKGSIADIGQGHYSPEQYLNLLTSLSDLELKVAGTLYEFQKDQNPSEMDAQEQREFFDSCRDRIIRELEIDPSDLSLIFERLTSTGLLERGYLPLVPGTQPPTFWASSMFGKIMKFLGM
jgi:hypothetical protein